MSGPTSTAATSSEAVEDLRIPHNHVQIADDESRLEAVAAVAQRNGSEQTGAAEASAMGHSFGQQQAGRSSFSWLDPHPIFVIVLIGHEERPFGIQKDFLCAKSAYFRRYFQENNLGGIEHIVRLPDTKVVSFAFAQHYMFTNQIFPEGEDFPTYSALVGLWRLGNYLEIDGLCDKTLEVMIELNRVSGKIPNSRLLIQVWNSTPEGSSIRKLLLSWAADFMRTSDEESRADMATSLPQEVLCQLVLSMTSVDNSLQTQPSTTDSQDQASTSAAKVQASTSFPARRSKGSANNAKGKNVHYLDNDDEEQSAVAGTSKRSRQSDVIPNGSSTNGATKSSSRSSLPIVTAVKAVQKRRSTGSFPRVDVKPTTEQKLTFCADLLTRMLSGPGFWTRLVGAFKAPVDPEIDDVPDYFEKIKKPMDLGTMKSKMDRQEYADEIEFLADMRLMFSNCYTYWNKKDPMYGLCEKLERTFEEKYSEMNKWITKMRGDEAD